MKPFAVIRSPTSDFSAIVVATGRELPHDDLELVASELRDQRIIGNVTFDLLASNGSRSNRFFCARFDGDRFASSVRFARIEPSIQLREASSDYFHEHLDDMDLSLLTPAMRFAVSRGLAI
jgi:hypothetical protein